MLENHYIVSARWVRPLSPAMRERTPPMITTCKPQDTNSSQATLRSAKLHSPADGSSQHQKFGSGCWRMRGCACAGCGLREPRPRYTVGTRNGHRFFIRANSCVMIIRHLLTNPSDASAATPPSLQFPHHHPSNSKNRYPLTAQHAADAKNDVLSESRTRDLRISLGEQESYDMRPTL